MIQAMIYDTYQPISEKLSEELTVKKAQSPQELSKNSQVIIFAAKPYILPSLLTELSSELIVNQLLISVTAGVTIESIEGILSTYSKIIRIMPNMPVLVGEGISA